MTSLSFGSFLTGGGGTLTVAPTGFRSGSGGVIPVGQGLGVSPAQISVSGTGYAMYSISLPADHVASLSDGNSHTLDLNNFVSNPNGTGTLSPAGTQTLSIGATLTVGSAQAAGAYSGSFSVTVNYQ